MNLLVLVLCTVLVLNMDVKGSCDVDDQTPTVWIGDEDDAFYCRGDGTYCGHFGLEFICEDPNGGETGPCINGTKVMCASTDPLPLAAPTSASTFRVISYNVWELRYLYYQNGQRERTCRIPRELVRLHPDVDVIVFNEVFMGGCFSEFNDTVGSSLLTMRDILYQYGFAHITETVGNPPELPKFENGGVFIASRWPIIREDSWIYTVAEPTTSDALSGKGAVYVQVEKTVGTKNRTYHVLGTHLQATQRADADEVRVAQAAEMHDLMLMQNIAIDEPVIYAGDLNAKKDTLHYNDVVGALDSTIPDIVGERIYTYDGVENDLLFTTVSQSWIDYVIHSKSHLQPVTATLEVVRPRSLEAFNVCMSAVSPVPTYPNSDRCLLSRSTQDLADHYAVMGVFEFEDTITTSVMTTDSGSNKSSSQLHVVIFVVSLMACFLM